MCTNAFCQHMHTLWQITAVVAAAAAAAAAILVVVVVVVAGVVVIIDAHHYHCHITTIISLSSSALWEQLCELDRCICHLWRSEPQLMWTGIWNIPSHTILSPCTVLAGRSNAANHQHSTPFSAILTVLESRMLGIGNVSSWASCQENGGLGTEIAGHPEGETSEFKRMGHNWSTGEISVVIDTMKSVHVGQWISYSFVPYEESLFAVYGLSSN